MLPVILLYGTVATGMPIRNNVGEARRPTHSRPARKACQTGQLYLARSASQTPLQSFPKSGRLFAGSGCVKSTTIFSFARTPTDFHCSCICPSIGQRARIL